ncbi:MAG: hypothetical protein SGBAC_011924 [Bacillariaceae sp.]
MSEKKTNEERQKEVDRQLELMKAAIGDDNFSDSDDSDNSDNDNDSDSEDDDSAELKERNTKNAAMESARKFLWDEADDDDEVMLGGPFPKAAPTHASAAGAAAAGDNNGATAATSGRVGMFGASIFGGGRRSGGGRGGSGDYYNSEEDGLGHQNINLMDASEAHAGTTNNRSSSVSSSAHSKSRQSLSNLFLRGSPSMAASWNDAGARDSDEFIHESSKRPSYLACLGWTLMWALTLSLFGVFGYYVYDFATSLKPASQPMVVDHSSPTDGEAIQQALLDAQVVTLSQIEDPNSPQNAALKWITQDDATVMEDDAFLTQRYALAVVYFSTHGQHWTNSDGWMSKSGYCQWYGVQCLGTDTIIEQSNHNGPVFELNLSSNNIQGTIPSEISTFSELFFLDLQDNLLEGTIPNDLGGWTGLRMFSIGHNQLYGSIPDTLLSTSPDLHILSAGHNQFSGSLPASMGDVTSLREIRLEFNDLEGTIPASFHALDRLETLHLAGNKLQGSLPHAVYDMDRLETLYLHENMLTGELSPDFSRLTHLELLTLHHNRLVGTVPDVFSRTRFLQELHLHNNELTGTMPSSVCALTTEHRLTYLSATCTETDNAGELGVHCDCCSDCM